MKRIIVLLLIIVVAIALWSGAWLFASDEIRKNVLQLASADGITTPRLTCETLDISGFPFRFDLDCTKASFTLADLQLTTPDLRATALIYRPTHVLASAQSPLTIADAFTGAQSQLAFTTLQASARTDGWRIARVSLNGTDMAWSNTLLGKNLIASSSLIDLQLGDIAEQYDAEKGLVTLAGYFQARNVVAPGLTIADGAAEIEIEASGLPDDIRQFGQADTLYDWQAANGQIKLVSLHASDAQSDLKASGNLALDAKGLLEGQITIVSNQVAERLKPYLIDPIRTLVLGNPAPDGSHTNRLNFRAGNVFSGLLPIGAIAPLF